MLRPCRKPASLLLPLTLAGLAALPACSGASDSASGPDAMAECENGFLVLEGVCTPVPQLSINAAEETIGLQRQYLSPRWRVPMREPTDEVYTTLAMEGPCTAIEWLKEREPALERYDDACADVGDVSITGTLEPVTLANECSDDRSHAGAAASSDGGGEPLFEPGDELTFDIAGGLDFPQHTATFQTATGFEQDDPALPAVVLGAAYEITWTPGNGDDIVFSLSNAWPHESFGRSIRCTVPDQGELTIPGNLTALLPTYANPTVQARRSLTRYVSFPDRQTMLYYNGSSFMVRPVPMGAR